MMERYIDSRERPRSSVEFLKKRKASPGWKYVRAFAFNGKFIIPTLMEVLDMSEDDAKAWFNDKTATEISIAQLVEDMKLMMNTNLANFRLLIYDRRGWSSMLVTDTDMLLNPQSLI